MHKLSENRVYSTTTVSAEGDPDVSIDDSGDLQIYPTGVAGSSVCLFMSAEKWDELAAAVAAARAGRVLT